VTVLKQILGQVETGQSSIADLVVATDSVELTSNKLRKFILILQLDNRPVGEDIEQIVEIERLRKRPRAWGVLVEVYAIESVPRQEPANGSIVKSNRFAVRAFLWDVGKLAKPLVKRSELLIFIVGSGCLAHARARFGEGKRYEDGTRNESADPNDQHGNTSSHIGLPIPSFAL
jgi:hypothetical protein